MRRRHVLLAVAVWLSFSAAAFSQQQQRPATTVQLPSFSFFSVSTAVSVPDSARGFGRVYAGGTKYAADGSSEFGAPCLPGNRAIASVRSAQGMSISAHIHDPEEADSILLSPEVREARAQRRAAANLATASGTKPVAETAADRALRSQAESPANPIRSVADIRRDREGAGDAKRQEALALIERGEQAQADG